MNRDMGNKRKQDASQLVVTEDDDASTAETDEYTDVSTNRSESEVTSWEESEEDDDEEEDEEEEDEEDDDEEEDDEEEDDEDEDEDEEDEDEEEEDEEDEEEEVDEAKMDDEDDASSTNTTTNKQASKTPELSSASIRESRSESTELDNAPLDLDTAKAILSNAPRPDPISPSVGAASMIEPEQIIENPFAEPEKLGGSDSRVIEKARKAPTLSAYTERHKAASEKAERINDTEYDLILARMVAQNRKLNHDPKAMRRSALGIGKLRKSFERLQMRNQPRSEAEADGVGSGSREFGLNLDDQHESKPVGAEEEAKQIDWEFWGGLIKDYANILATSPIELSKAIYTGIPAVLRGMMWQLLSSSKDEELETQYAKYLTLPCPHESLIRRDLSRTFPSQEFFKDAKGVGQESLYNVVKAYSLYDPECGYCQGMQFVVGPLLLNMPDEEAFSTFVRLMQNYDLRGHFIPNMPALQLRLYQFDRLLEDMLPVLNNHFLRRGIRSSMYASQWFMTLFSYRFPLEIVYRILDSIFAEGIDAMFRFAIAFLEKNEEKLLTLDFEQCLDFLKINLIDVYRVGSETEPMFRTGELVRDAFRVKIPQYMLESYANDFYEQAKALNDRQIEMDALRTVNRNLRIKVQTLEDQLNQLNTEHVNLIKRVVMEKLSQEEMAEELVRYKVMYAEAVLQNEKAS